MKTLQVLLDDYLTMRRMLGTKLEESERLLHQFVSFLAQHGAKHITTELALEWATLPREARPPYRARRLAAVRHLARYASAVDPDHQVPPEGLLPYGSSRRSPHIYSDEEVTALIDAAHGLSGQVRGSDLQVARSHFPRTLILHDYFLPHPAIIAGLA